jgi:hypothetical protein
MRPTVRASRREGRKSLPKIIISYRRQDSQDMAMRIRDMLAPHYGEESVFTDIDSIPLGTDFLEHLNTELATCDAMIAIVGPRWLDGGLGPGHGVHEETDFVRIEVEAALSRKIPVIPSLVSGATMPKPAELPDALRRFAFRNGTAIDSGVNFRNDTNRLIRSLDESFAAKKQATGDVSKPTRENVAAGQPTLREPKTERANSPGPTGPRSRAILERILMPVAFAGSDPWHLTLAKVMTLLGVYVAYGFLILMNFIVFGIVR